VSGIRVPDPGIEGGTAVLSAVEITLYAFVLPISMSLDEVSKLILF
jgi:hypothetical protein